jgi:outer membrane lipopolysaccharide assembly protein LptE/RlpB
METKMNKIKLKFLTLFAATSLLLLLNGCGYHIGHLMHPQIKSIAIAPVKNETLAYNVPALVRNMLTEAFMRDGALKVKSLREADCILYARVIKITYRETTPASFDNEITYRPIEWRIWMTVEFTIIIPGNKEPLVKKQIVKADALFQVQADYFINRHRGIQQCSWHLARKLAQQVTESW